jgi:hypothetical protein
MLCEEDASCPHPGTASGAQSQAAHASACRVAHASAWLPRPSFNAGLAARTFAASSCGLETSYQLMSWLRVAFTAASCQAAFWLAEEMATG